MFTYSLLFYHSDGTITGPHIDAFCETIKGLKCKSHIKFDGCNLATIFDTEKFFMDSGEYYTLKAKVENTEKHMFTVETFCVDKDWFKSINCFDNMKFKVILKTTTKGNLQFINEQPIGEIILEDL